MLVKNFLSSLWMLDTVTIYAETFTGAEKLYKGTVHGIPKGLWENWQEAHVVGIWQWGGQTNLVIADAPNAVMIPRRIWQAVKRGQARLQKELKSKTF